MKRFLIGAALLSLLSVPVSAVDDSEPEIPKEEAPAFTVVQVEAPEGDADLNTLAAVTMFGFGSVCGILAGSEVVRKWTL